MATEPELSQLVCRIVKMIAPVQPECVKLEDRLASDLGFHSLAMVELAFAIEDLFMIDDMPIEQATGIKSVGDIPPIVLSALERGIATMPSTAALANFTAEYGFSWEESGNEPQARK